MTPLPPITVFDVETTGLDPKRGHRIVELAGVRIENGEIVESTAFDYLINPERDIPWESKQIHHVSDADVADAPTIMTVLPEFLEFASDSILAAHNAQFDLGFLEAEKEVCWGYIDIPPCICTMRLSQAIFPTAFRHNLDVLAERLEIPLPVQRHRALPDVLTTAKALLKMVDKAHIQSKEQLLQLGSLQQQVAA